MAVDRNGSRTRIRFVASVAATTSRIAIQDVFLSDLNALVKRRAEVPQNPGSSLTNEKTIEEVLLLLLLSGLLGRLLCSLLLCSHVIYLLRLVIGPDRFHWFGELGLLLRRPQRFLLHVPPL